MRALVIGATGGIGAALAAKLEQGRIEVDRLSRSGSNSIDLTDENSIAFAATSLAGRAPYSRIIVATGMLHRPNAGPEKSWRELDAARLAENFQINAIGPMLVARHFVPLIARAQPGVLAFLSARVGSISDNRLGGWYGYRASKAALNQFVRTLAIDLARSHPQLACVALHPGTVDTALSAPFQRNVPADRLFSPSDSAMHLMRVMDELTPADSGQLIDWSGKRVAP